MKNKTIICLSCDRTEDGELTLELKKRLLKTFELYNKGEVKRIIVAGGKGIKENQSLCTQAKAMKEFLMEKGVPNADIIEEENSKDTVGQILFSRYPYTENVIIITSDYHIKRVKEIAKVIYGKNKFKVIGINYKKVDKNILENERKSLNIFLNQFGDVNKGNYDEIRKRLFEVHPLYNGTIK